MLSNEMSIGVRLKTVWYEIKSFVYIIFFEPFLIKQVWKLFKLRGKIKDRAEQIKRRSGSIGKVEEWMK